MTPNPREHPDVSRHLRKNRWRRLFRRRHRSQSADAVDDSGPPRADEASSDSARESDPPVATDVSDGDWDQIPPTEKQLRYIVVLGGDPATVNTKRQASEEIDRLGRLRRGSPLDPAVLEERGRAAGANAGGDWKSAHDGMLAGLRLEMQEYVDQTLVSLRQRLGNRPKRHVLTGDLLQRFEGECKRLGYRRKQGIRPAERQLVESGANSPPPTGDDSVSRGERSKTLDLIGWLALCIVGEAVVNIALLWEALPGGFLRAFLIALLVSVINVGFVGAGLGFLAALIKRHVGLTARFWGFASAVALLALSFNHLLGRHREAFTRIIEATEQEVDGGPPVPPLREVLATVEANPLAWELQPLLFALLGIGLCAVGFAKGFTFPEEEVKAKVKREEDGEPLPVTLGTEDGSNSRRVAFATAYVALLDEYDGRLSRAHDEIGKWYGVLDQDRRRVNGVVRRLQEDGDRQACIECLEYAFVVAFNSHHAEKTDSGTLAAHRDGRSPEPLQVTPSDPEVLKETNEVADWWDKSGASELDDALAEARNRLVSLWEDYESPVLGTAVQ